MSKNRLPSEPHIGMKPLKEGEESKPITFKVPESVQKMIDEKAKELGFKRSTYIRFLIDRDLENLDERKIAEILVEANNKLKTENIKLRDQLKYRDRERETRRRRDTKIHPNQRSTDKKTDADKAG